MKLSTFILLPWIVFPLLLHAQIQKKEQDYDVNYKEELVPPYDLPRLFETDEGKQVKLPEQWVYTRRPQILSSFSNLIYGRIPVPEDPITTSYKEELSISNYLNGLATRKVVQIKFGNKRGEVDMHILVIYPNKAQQPVPALMQLSFDRIDSRKMALKDNNSATFNNGVPIRDLIERGYGYVAVYHQDVIGHNEVEFQRGIHQLFFREGQSFPKANEWGVLGAISWSAMQALDYLEQDPAIQASQVALMGHSKLGKATLWAAAQDQRFAMAISAQSGCGGAALWRRKYGETLAKISIFPHWLATNARKFIHNEQDLPVDQHMLLALIAPRPIYVSSAEDDHWADPRGEYLSAYHASEVYRLMGSKGLERHESPSLRQPMQEGAVGYHIRKGGHTVNPYDWEQYLKFMDKHMGPR